VDRKLLQTCCHLSYSSDLLFRTVDNSDHGLQTPVEARKAEQCPIAALTPQNLSFGAQIFGTKLQTCHPYSRLGEDLEGP